MELAYLAFTLLCPLSMVLLLGWWAWALRKSRRAGDPQAMPSRSATDDGEIVRLRAHLDQLEAGARLNRASASG